jgi:phage baseplate assembly protein W
MAGFDTELANNRAGALISGTDKYRQYLHNLILTAVYDRWFSGFGIDLDDSVFENYEDSDVEFSLIVKLESAVKRYIPEIKLSFSRSVITVDRENNAINLSLVYEYGGETYTDELVVRV